MIRGQNILKRTEGSKKKAKIKHSRKPRPVEYDLPEETGSDQSEKYPSEIDETDVEVPEERVITRKIISRRDKRPRSVREIPEEQEYGYEEETQEIPELSGREPEAKEIRPEPIHKEIQPEPEVKPIKEPLQAAPPKIPEQPKPSQTQRDLRLSLLRNLSRLHLQNQKYLSSQNPNQNPKRQKLRLSLLRNLSRLHLQNQKYLSQK